MIIKLCLKEYSNSKFYNKQAQIVIDFCNSEGIDYHIKSGTITK